MVGIESGCSLVEDEQVGLMDDGLRDTDTLSVSSRECFDRAIENFGNTALFGNGLNGIFAFFAWNLSLSCNGIQGIADEHVEV